MFGAVLLLRIGLLREVDMIERVQLYFLAPFNVNGLQLIVKGFGASCKGEQMIDVVSTSMHSSCLPALALLASSTLPLSENKSTVTKGT